LCIHNYLMLFINSCHAIKALNSPFAGRHLSAFIISDFTSFGLRPCPIRGVELSKN
jgi:hypothetical protein